jgi:hypothetical protein
MPKNINPVTVRGPDRYLTNFSLELSQSNGVFKAANILPSVPVQRQTDIYRIYNADSLRKLKMKPLASGTPTAAGDIDFSEGTYYTKTYGLHVDYDAETKANTESDLQLGQMATEYLTTQSMMHQERQWFDKMFTAGKWATDKVGGTDFNKFTDATSDPIGVVKSAVTQQQILAGGIRPNVLVLTRKVMDTLEEHPDIIDRLNRGQTSGPAMASEQALAALFGLQRVVVLEAVMADEATGDNEFVGGNHMLLMYLNGNAGLRSITAAVRFEWTRLGQFMTTGQVIRVFDLDPVIEGTTRYEIKSNYDFRIVAPVLGTFFQDAV